MRRKIEILILFLLVFVAAGCNKAPIDPEKMEDIMFDIYRTDACISVTKPSISSEERVKLYDSIFEKYGVTKEEFDETLDWYAHNSKEWQLLHQNLVTRSEDYLKKTEEYAFSPKEKPVVQDSIDTFDLWMPKINWEWRAGKDGIDRRQTDYTLDNRKYFIGAVSIKFQMKMRCWSKNDDDSVTTMMVLKYSKGANDTLRYKAHIDSVEKIYTFTKKIPEGKSISMVHVLVMDTVDNLLGVNVNGTCLKYAYNKHKNSIRLAEKDELYDLRRELRDEKIENDRLPLLRARAGEFKMAKKKE